MDSLVYRTATLIDHGSEILNASQEGLASALDQEESYFALPPEARAVLASD